MPPRPASAFYAAHLRSPRSAEAARAAESSPRGVRRDGPAGGVVEYVAGQLDVAAAMMATYTQREKTRLGHQWDIAREVGYRDFVDAEAELAVWVDDPAWTTGEGPVAIFNGAVVWLRERRVLLPG